MKELPLASPLKAQDATAAAPYCRAVHGLHTPRFTLDEGVLKLGAALHTALALEYLEQFPAKQAEPAKEEL